MLAYGTKLDSWQARPVPAAEENRDRAKKWISKRKTDGMTNLAGALVAAMETTRPGMPLRDTAIPAPTDDKFDAGIVFVFDTTQSMRPYIESTQKAVQRIVDDLAGTDQECFCGVALPGFSRSSGRLRITHDSSMRRERSTES